MERMRFFICTRNRPETAMRCITSLVDAYSVAYPYSNSQIYIIDDSTNSEYFDALQKAISKQGYNNIQITAISRATRLDTLKRFKSETHDDELKRAIDYFFEPNDVVPVDWDVSRVRNYAALLAYNVSNDDDIVVFLDDDILLADSNYFNRPITVQGSRVLRDVRAYLRDPRIVAVGTGYWGRIDISVIEHIGKVCDALAKNIKSNQLLEAEYGDLLNFPHTLPVFIEYPSTSDHIEMQLGPGGVSAAFIAFRRSQLETHGFMRCYNEDWIWQLFLDSDRTIVKLDQKLIHAPPRNSKVETTFAYFQEFGEVVFSSLETAFTNLHLDSRRNSLDWIRMHLEPSLVERSQQRELERIQTSIESAQKLQQVVDNEPSVFEPYRGARAWREAVSRMIGLLESAEQYTLDLKVSDVLAAVQLYTQSNHAWPLILNHWSIMSKLFAS